MPDFKSKSVPLDLGYVRPFRLARPALFAPEKFKRVVNGQVQVDESSTPQYSTFLVASADHPELKTFYDAVMAMVREAFPDAQFDAKGFPIGIRVPLIEGDAYAAAEPGSKWRQSFRGLWLIRAGTYALTQEGSTKRRPALAVRQGTGEAADVPYGEEDKYQHLFFGGVEAQAFVGLKPNSSQMGRGVKCYLNGITSCGTGARVEEWCSGDGSTSMAARSARVTGHVGTVQAGSPMAGPTAAQARPQFA